jgi:ABC-type nickel/cobalt efflux system permease component RcnA
MVNETKTLFYSEELNEDINQNSSLLKSKEILTYNKSREQINTTSYNSIVDSIDYLGCINGNCSKIKCDCNNANCNCNQSQTHNPHHNNQHHNNQHHNNQHHNQHHNRRANFITNLVDFIFVLFIIIVLINILYTRNGQHLLYVLGITIVYIFYKIYIISG